MASAEIAALITQVRNELEGAARQRDAEGGDPMFLVKAVTLTIHFNAEEKSGDKAGFDIKVINFSLSDDVAKTAGHQIVIEMESIRDPQTGEFSYGALQSR